MIEVFIAVAAKVILQNASSLAANEFAIAWGFKESLRSLHNHVELIQAKLRDAEGKKGSEGVTTWLKQLKDVVSEAGDLLDEVRYKVLRCEVKKRDPRLEKIRSLPFRTVMGRRIVKINTKLSDVNKQASRLGLQNEPQGPAVPNSLMKETHSYLDEFKIVGREKDEEYVVELLTEYGKEERLTIVPVVGMGGIGKTTLAKSVYNNQQIQRHFDVKAWLCVSVKVSKHRLLEMVYESLTNKKCELPNTDILITKLREELGSKRYLLVLDDVWDDGRTYWDDFMSCVRNLNSQKGNGIVITTRKLELGTSNMTNNSCYLQGLSDDEGWFMFQERAKPLPELEEIGRDIVKKCRGLPLLIKLIGSMLQNYSGDKDKWSDVQERMVWGEEEGDMVLSTLKLSFDSLPNSVSKQCFAYCSIFRKDHVMIKEELIQIWMALGFLQVDGTRNSDMEDVGNDIFKILVRNSLLQDFEMDKYGYVYSCKMHDLVHDLSLHISGDETLCLLVPTSEKVHNPHIKHLSMYQEEHNDSLSYKFIEGMESRNLHTLFLEADARIRIHKRLLFGSNSPERVEKNISIKNFKCLRILKLSGTTRRRIDDSVGDLVHLRYLDLSWTEIEVIPKSITKLHQLQTLKLLRCFQFKKFPEGMRNMISLRHLEFSYVIPPKDVGQLTSLRTLSFFDVRREKGCKIGELGSLKHLGGKLVIFNLEEVGSKEEAIQADIVGKKNLYKIEFCWDDSIDGVRQKDKDILEGLQTHENVKSLKIKNYSSDCFPEWVMNMSSNFRGKWISLDKLVDITLFGCRSVLSLPMVLKLPLLRDLMLEDMDSLTSLSSSVGLGSSEPLSRSLRNLTLWGMKRLEKWTDAAATNSSTMISPVLETLSIIDCPNIIMLDEQYPHPLVKLEIFKCTNLESIGSLQGLTSLESLRINDCDSLVGIPDFHNLGGSLKTLTIENCSSLIGIPDLHNLGGSLRQLWIYNCGKLTSVPSGIGSLTLLYELRLGPFSKELDSFPSLKGIEKLRSSNLRDLTLEGYDHWERIPEEVKHLTSLELLVINGFGIKEIPKWLTNMSSIKRIEFENCPGLDDADSVLKGAPTQAKIVRLNYKRLR